MPPCHFNHPRSDQHGFEVASAWKVSVCTHVVRRADYKGRSAAVSQDRARLAFDAMTTVGLLFAAA